MSAQRFVAIREAYTGHDGCSRLTASRPTAGCLDAATEATLGALTEQPRPITRERLTKPSGRVSDECLAEVEERLRDFLGLH